MAVPAGPRRKAGAGQPVVGHQPGLVDEGPQHQRHVVGRGQLLPAVQAGRGLHHRVVGTQPGGLGVHPGHRPGHPAVGLGQRQRPRRWPRPATARRTADRPSTWPRPATRPPSPRRWPPSATPSPPAGRAGPRDAERGEHLEDAGRLVAPVRVAGGQHGAGVQVDQDPAVRPDARRAASARRAVPPGRGWPGAHRRAPRRPAPSHRRAGAGPGRSARLRPRSASGRRARSGRRRPARSAGSGSSRAPAQPLGGQGAAVLAPPQANRQRPVAVDDQPFGSCRAMKG